MESPEPDQPSPPPPNRFAALIAGVLMMSYFSMMSFCLLNIRHKWIADGWKLSFMAALVLIAGTIYQSILVKRPTTVVAFRRMKGALWGIHPLWIAFLLIAMDFHNICVITIVSVLCLLWCWMINFDVARHVTVLTGELNIAKWQSIIFTIQAIAIGAIAIVAAF